MGQLCAMATIHAELFVVLVIDTDMLRVGGQLPMELAQRLSASCNSLGKWCRYLSLRS